MADEPQVCWCDGFKHRHHPGQRSWECPEKPVAQPTHESAESGEVGSDG